MAMRLPIRRTSRTARPSTLATGGCAVRSRKAFPSRTRWSGCATMRGSRAVIYATISGSSGMLISLHVATAFRNLGYSMPEIICAESGRIGHPGVSLVLNVDVRVGALCRTGRHAVVEHHHVMLDDAEPFRFGCRALE